MNAIFGEVVSPLRQEAPKPRHPDQSTMFTTDMDTTFATVDRPMTMAMSISLYRVTRQKCDACGGRRICYYIGFGAAYKSPTMCAKCSGIR